MPSFLLVRVHVCGCQCHGLFDKALGYGFQDQGLWLSGDRLVVVSQVCGCQSGLWLSGHMFVVVGSRLIIIRTKGFGIHGPVLWLLGSKF